MQREVIGAIVPATRPIMLVAGGSRPAAKRHQRGSATSFRHHLLMLAPRYSAIFLRALYLNATELFPCAKIARNANYDQYTLLYHRIMAIPLA